MGERKVLNKYVPWDFDPSKLPKGRMGNKNKLAEVRMMLPCSIRCLTCGEFMGQGKKFNSKKELVEGEDYHGLRIWRFYGKCANCSAVFAIKTDPSRDDYIVEMGASRNFQLWRAEEDAGEEAKAAKEEQEKYDAMRALENRTSDSKRQMDVLDALDEIKALNKRNASVDPQMALDKLAAAGGGPAAGTGAGGNADAEGRADAELDSAVRKAFGKRRVRRLEDAGADAGAQALATPFGSLSSLAATAGAPSVPKFVVGPTKDAGSLQPPAKKPRFAVRKRRKPTATASDAASGNASARDDSAGAAGAAAGGSTSPAAASRDASGAAAGNGAGAKAGGSATTPQAGTGATNAGAGAGGLGLGAYASSSSSDSD